MTGRAVPEWIGKTPDTPVPTRVKLRVFEKYDGICHWSRRKIWSGDKWDIDHVLAICNGGENRESNLAPILRGKPHKEKTRADMAIKKRSARIRKKHLGLNKPKQVMDGGRGSRWFKPLRGNAVRRDE